MKNVFLRFVLSYFALSLFISCHSQSIMTNQTSLPDFGLVGDGKTDNTVAFGNMSQWLEGKTDITYTIPPGVYLVGRQAAASGHYLKGDIVLFLSRCKNVVIKGENRVTIKYRDGLKYGSFNPKTGSPFLPPKMPFSSPQYRATLGNCIQISNSSNVRVEGLKLDGNAPKMLFGGTWGNKGTQLQHSGIRIANSSEVVIEDLEIINFCLDGINILNNNQNKDKLLGDSVIISNCHVKYSGRQGLSWVGGYGLQVLNSIFEGTGKGSIRSSPAAGIDIEPIKNRVCSNGLFEGITLRNNAGVSFLIGNKRSGLMQIKNSTLSDLDNTSIWPRGGDVRFNNCKIVGPLAALNTSLGKKILFQNCTFTDSLYKGKRKYFIDAGGNSGNVEFIGNKFYISKLALFFVEGNSKTNPFRLKDNEFIVTYTSPRNSKRIGVFNGGIFENNRIISTFGAGKEDYSIRINSKSAKTEIKGTNRVEGTRIDFLDKGVRKKTLK